MSFNNVGLQLGNTGQEFKSKTLATIGQGAVVTGDMITGQDSLAGVNRDAFNTETIIKDMQTGGLAVDTGIDTRVFTQAGREEIAKEQRELGKNIKTTGKITAAAGVQGVATAGNILSQNQTLSQAIQGLKAPAKMAQAIQDNPEVAAILQGYQQGDYDGLLNSQAALQALADSTGVSVDVIITNITQEMRTKGATDGQLVAIDQDPTNRKDAVKTTAHELDHVRGGSSETLANLAGIAADLNVSASMDANQDQIDSYKPTLGDGKDAITQAENKEQLNKNDITLITAVEKAPESFDYKTSYIQDIKYALTYFSPGARQAYEKIDASQEAAFLRGQKKALNDIGQGIVAIPEDMQALYQAAKENPAAVATEMLKALKDLPKEYYDKGADIVSASFVGDSDDDFYNSGIATTELSFEAVTAIVSAGGAVVIKKGIGNTLDIDIIPPSRNPNRKPNGDANYNAGNSSNSSNTGSNNKPNSQSTNTIGNDNYFDSFNNDINTRAAASKAEQNIANITNSKDLDAQQKTWDNEQKAWDTEQKLKQAENEAYIQQMSDSSQARGNELKAEQKALEAKSEADRRAANERLGIPSYSNQTSDVDSSNPLGYGDYVLPTGRQSIDPTRTSFSQATVSYQKTGKDYNYDTIVADMKTNNSWIGEPVDVVNMPDGAPTSMDNTRVLAAREANVKVEANVHNNSDPLTLAEADRFAYNGVTPTNWGEAIGLRIQKQESQKGVPKGWSEEFPNGSIYDPEVIK